MPVLFVDFETRSQVDLVDKGLPLYAADPSTVPLMLAYGTEKWQNQWTLRRDGIVCPEDLARLLLLDDVEIHAHNASFEIIIWDEICVKRWGWPEIPLERWHCTAAKGAYANQPRALANLVKRLGLPAEYHKDGRGKSLIGALSVPTKAQKTYKHKGIVNKLSQKYQEEIGTELFAGQDPKALYFFNNDSELMEEFEKYNKQDIVAESAADRRLPPMPESERAVWLLDRRINQRGIPIDLDLCRGAVKVCEEEVNCAHARMVEITNGLVPRCSMRQKLVDWLNVYVNWGESLAAETVTEWVETHEHPDTWAAAVHPGLIPETVMPLVLEALELRQLAGGTAVAKYQAALDCCSADGRAREQILYYGAATGRWSGKGIQPHNIKRAATPDETFIEVIKTGDRAAVAEFAAMEGTTPYKLLKSALRGMILAPEGKKLIVSDFAGIEARVLNWLCKNETKLELFRNSQDVYIHTALDVYDCNAADIADWNGQKWKIKKEHEEKRQVGKVAELALGYQMGAVKFQATAARAGSILTSEFAETTVRKWREANVLIKAFWYDLEAKCREVVSAAYARRNIQRVVNGLKIGWTPQGYLHIELPSGRKLFYYGPAIVKEDKWDKLYYYDGGKTGTPENKGRINTYGGKLVENITQAISRDLLVNSMMIIDKAGLDIILHVHDEVVVEVDENDNEAFGIVHAAMQSIPDWAYGLPLAAETQQMRRYSK